MATVTDDQLLEILKATWETTRAVEPAPGADPAQLAAVRTAIEKLAAAQTAGLAALSGDDRTEAQGALTAVYARAAAVAYACGDEATGYQWVLEAERLCEDDDVKAELGVARRKPERYRTLVHGRNLAANRREPAARKLWTQLIAEDASDGVGRSARRELDAPRPVESMPSLWRWNGIGLGFYGERDRDGETYVTTHCFSAVWVPLIPIAAYRVARSEGGYLVIAREQLSRFAKLARLAVPAMVAVAIAGAALYSHFTDPARLAGNRFEAAIDAADTPPPDAALARLDDVLAGNDLDLVDRELAERAGAAVVRVTAGLVPAPFTAAQLDQATRVVRRYDGLPERARGGVARDTLVATLDAWIEQVPADAGTQLALLREELAVVASWRADRAISIEQRIATTRVAVAAARRDQFPLDALAILLEPPIAPAAHAAATPIVESIVDSPALLADVGPDLDAWMAAAPAGPLVDRVRDGRAAADRARPEVEAEGVTPAKLAAMLAARPWDQRVVLALAHADASAGKLAAAADRLRAIGPPGRMIRDARIMLAELLAAQDQLAEADTLVTDLLAVRLQRFAAAASALEQAAATVQAAADDRLRSGSLPPDVIAKLEAAGDDEAAQRDIVIAWMGELFENDPNVRARRAAYEALADVVSIAVAAGSIKLRRAQALAGPERDAMLADAERTFLAIRAEAEGQPEFHLGLAEIYARLGKSDESEAEFKRVLDERDPTLSFKVANVYRGIGAVERAKAVAREVYDTATSPIREDAAVLLSLMGEDDDEVEGWLRKADQTSPFVRTSLIELAAGRAQRQGDYAGCAAKFAEAARAHAMASTANLSGYNNAALAHSRRYGCTGELAALHDAEVTLDKAYRAKPDDPIVVGNLAALLRANALIRVLGRRVNAGAMRLTGGDELLAALVGDERDAVIADLARDPTWRRSQSLYAQLEVLAPSRSDPYDRAFGWARRQRDEVAAAAVLERMKRARLETGSTAERRARWIAGEHDAEVLESAKAEIARLTDVLARGKLDAKTRAAALYERGTTRASAAVVSGDAAMLADGRVDLVQAMELWPALDASSVIAVVLLDEAGLAADAAAWQKQRRTLGSAAALTQLGTASGAGAAIVASAQFREAVKHTAGNRARPGMHDIRLAALSGDAALAQRAAAARADRLVRLGVELELLEDPTDPQSLADLAILDAK